MTNHEKEAIAEQLEQLVKKAEAFTEEHCTYHDKYPFMLGVLSSMMQHLAEDIRNGLFDEVCSKARPRPVGNERGE